MHKLSLNQHSSLRTARLHIIVHNCHTKPQNSSDVLSSRQSS